jgi:hypothetical protein
MPMHERLILLMLLPYRTGGVQVVTRGDVPEGCSDDRSFYYWRHCTKSSDLSVSKVNYSSAVTPLNDPSYLPDFGCVAERAIYSPSQDQITYDESETPMSHILSNIAPIINMVYILCIDCSALRVPHGLHNILLMNGRASDECYPGGTHYERVTFAHKAAVAHARTNKFANLTIIEEDLMINPMINELPDFVQIERQLQVRLAEHPNQLVRFTSLPYELAGRGGACKYEGCMCHSDSVTPDLCSLPHGCGSVHDSSFYMIPNSLFGEFVKFPLDGTIDLQLFASFDSVLVIPPITVQRGFACYRRQCGSEDQVQMWKTYEEVCVIH